MKKTKNKRHDFLSISFHHAQFAFSPFPFFVADVSSASITITMLITESKNPYFNFFFFFVEIHTEFCQVPLLLSQHLFTVNFLSASRTGAILYPSPLSLPSRKKIGNHDDEKEPYHLPSTSRILTIKPHTKKMIT